jgi:hypothetical protein
MHHCASARRRLRCRVHKELVCESRGNRFESEDSRLIRRPCRCGEPEGRRPRNRSWWGVLLRRDEHWRNKFLRANAKFTQPEVWPTPDRPHRSGQNVDRRDNRQHHCAGARVTAKVCCDPVVVGPTNRPVCATGRQSAAEPVCLIPRGRILEVSTEVWLNPHEFQASCAPRTGFAIPRTWAPKRSGVARV